MSVERSKAGTKKKRPDGLSYPDQNIITINKILLLFYKIWIKYNEMQLTKNKMDQIWKYNIIQLTKTKIDLIWKKYNEIQLTKNKMDECCCCLELAWLTERPRRTSSSCVFLVVACVRDNILVVGVGGHRNFPGGTEAILRIRCPIP